MGVNNLLKVVTRQCRGRIIELATIESQVQRSNLYTIDSSHPR